MILRDSYVFYCYKCGTYRLCDGKICPMEDNEIIDRYSSHIGCETRTLTDKELVTISL